MSHELCVNIDGFSSRLFSLVVRKYMKMKLILLLICVFVGLEKSSADVEFETRKCIF